MKKRILSLFMTMVMLAVFVPVFEISADAAGSNAKEMPNAETAGAGRISVSDIGTDSAFRLVFPDGTKSSWSVYRDGDEDTVIIQPLDGGEYYLETCLLSELKIVDPDAEMPAYKYDLWSDVAESKIQTSEKIVVAQPEDEGDNVVDIAEGDVLLSSSYNEYAVFSKEHDFNDSEFDYSAVTHAPAVKYVSTDDGATWKKLTGDVTITSSAADTVANGVNYELYCGDYITTITLDNIKTTGKIETAPFGDTIVKIKGDVSLNIIDTEYFGNLIIQGVDSNAKLTVTRALISSSVEIKDLAELKIESPNIAINSFMGDVKLTDIRKMYITVTSEYYATAIRSYDGNVIFTDVYGIIELINDPDGKAVETDEDKNFIINTSGSYVYAGTDRADLQMVTLKTKGTGNDKITGIFPEDKMAACLSVNKSEADMNGSYQNCLKDEDCPINDYTDAVISEWYHDGVHYCIDNGIMGGYGNGIFGPNDQVTRQQVWITLARISGETPANEAEAREWAMQTGVSDGTYPANAVTRQQFITMLYRFAVDKGYDVSVGEDTNILSYNDAFDVAEYAIPAVQWGCGSGVMGGYDDGTLKPVETTSRAQLATFLQRFCENIIK